MSKLQFWGSLSLFCTSLLFNSAALAYYPKDYRAARATFRLFEKELENQYGEQLSTGHFKTPSQRDDDLTTDYIHLKCGRGDKLILLTSGVHGPESFVGSAAQLDFLKNGIKKRCQQGLSSLVIHAINPYGFKYNRRFDEDNVDLNRNFSLKNSIYEKANKDYEVIEGILNPKKVLSPLSLQAWRMSLSLVHRLLGGMETKTIRQASVGGQYQFPDGIYYGGKKLQPVGMWLKLFLGKVLNQYDEVLHFDFHTGLGEDGVLHLFPSQEQSPYAMNLKKKALRPLEGKYFKFANSEDDGFYQIEGDIIDFIPELKLNGRVASFTAEFGTMGLGILPQLRTLGRIVKENQGHHHGYSSEEMRERTKKRYKELFFPDQRKWRKKVQKANDFLLGEVIDSFVQHRN